MTPDGSTLTLLRLSPEDSGTYTCLAVSPAGQESKIYTLFVLGQFEHFICVSALVPKFLSDLFSFDLTRRSPTIHLRWDHGPQRGAGHTGQCCDSGVSGSRKPSTSDQLAEERTSFASLSSYTSPIWRLCAEVSLDTESWIQTWLFVKRLHVYIGEVMLSVPFLYEKGFLLCSCLTPEFTHAWRAVELVLPSSAMMSRSKVKS